MLRYARVMMLVPMFILGACDESTTNPADSGAKDQTAAAEGGPAPDVTGAPDSKAPADAKKPADSAKPVDSAKPMDTGLSADKTPAPMDQKLALDKGDGKDQGACQQNGQQCGTGFGSCCSGLKCCSGMPIPPGKSICYVSCPMSDRALKYGARPVTSAEVLERLSRLPISSWTYNNEPPGVRHIGPMAQDFNAAFGVGADPRFISPVDADGVTMAALQALDKQLKQLRCEVSALRKENVKLRREVRALRR